MSTETLPSALALGLARTRIELKEFFRLRETVFFSPSPRGPGGAPTSASR